MLIQFTVTDLNNQSHSAQNPLIISNISDYDAMMSSINSQKTTISSQETTFISVLGANNVTFSIIPLYIFYTGRMRSWLTCETSNGHVTQTPWERY